MKLGYALAMTAMMAMAAGVVRAAPTGQREVYRTISYYVSQHVHGTVDDRIVDMQIGLMNGDYARFSLREYVRGATTTTVKVVNYENQTTTEISAAQMDTLLKALGDAGIGSLKSDGYAQSDYRADIRVDVGNRGKHLHFEHPPTDGARMAVHKVLFDFVHQLDIDRPLKPGAETISEGDSVPAASVELRELLAHPDLYDGKRVRTVGYYHGEFEGMNLCIDKTAAQAHDYEHCLWQGEASTFADEADIDNGNDRWETIDGVFFKGPGGHLGLWPGEMARLTRIKPLVPAVKSK